MSACEKCWRDSRREDNYSEVLESRRASPCTPEEQAGPDAKRCPLCKRLVLHQITGECMNGCEIMTRDEVAKALGFKGQRDTRLRDPDTCSHVWKDMETGKRTLSARLMGRMNCASFASGGGG